MELVSWLEFKHSRRTKKYLDITVKYRHFLLNKKVGILNRKIWFQEQLARYHPSFYPTTRKSCIHLQKYLITSLKWFQTVGYSKNGFTLISIMVSTNTTFGLSKRRLNGKPVSARRNDAFDKKSVSISRKAASAVRNWKSWRKLVYP